MAGDEPQHIGDAFINITYVPCLVKGTKVIMKDGTEVPIERIKPGDKIKTYSINSKKISKAEVAWIQEPRFVNGYYEIKAEDGTILKITGEHPVFIMTNDKKGKFIIVKKLRIGQKFLNKDNQLVKIINKKYVKSEVKVHNFTVDKFHNFFGTVLCHNGY